MPRAVSQREYGFTLIELLVAIAILALVAILSWRGLDQIMRARDAVTAAMENERTLAQFFDQFSTDTRAAVADDVISAPAIRVDHNRLQIARHFDALGQAPRVQLVRYYRQGQRLVRAASPLLNTRAALRAALAAPMGTEEGWHTVTLMRDAIEFKVRVWVPRLGWSNKMTTPPESSQNAALQGSIHPRSVDGIEIRARGAGVQRAVTRIALAGE